ncbi:MAG: tRNA (guanosine(18)-2'-O)-methyltransferase TrmH [Prochlorococcus sp.]|jgi:tRNA (guanosine-2'-O-)-methyltransferase|nr:tRNA (guanosine(18)-2'-O)-methyltransferase TrmH [Prochlorococcaceae cyanobacterium ETNP14_MAG_4]HJM80947.1 tRNA (guanosine(18)-2'-O)-methyltransferase TrmH [Prochlorococcaceae cyanobacterium Fu_MAG_72]|tara:strand:+ start:7655 stop:8344 length:690 start_codon:yes stop_codon:yes gene_type:complete
MPLLPRRFARLKAVLDCRMADLTVLLEHVEKPHNLSAILRSCDAVGVLDAHAVSYSGRLRTFNSTAQGSQKWVPLKDHSSIEVAVTTLKKRGFRLYGTHLDANARDYRDCDFCGPTAFVLGAERWGLGELTASLMDEGIFIPMRGMVQSLNVSVAAATLLFEALRQRQVAGIAPNNGEGLEPALYKQRLFEWAYPEVATWCQQEGRQYPALNEQGEIQEALPRNVKLRY